jgi:hypothetical protein
MLVVAYGLFGFGYVITATFLVAMVRLAPELQALEGWIWIVFGFAAVPSVAVWSWLGSRLGLMTTFAVACLAEAVAWRPASNGSPARGSSSPPSCLAAPSWPSPRSA